MDRYTPITGLMQETGCNGQALRWIPIPQLLSRLGVGSTFEAKPAADAIREEIGALAEEGKLAEAFGQWGFMSGRDVASVESLLDAKRRETRLITVAGAGSAAFACGRDPQGRRACHRAYHSVVGLRAETGGTTPAAEFELRDRRVREHATAAGGRRHPAHHETGAIARYGDGRSRTRASDSDEPYGQCPRRDAGRRLSHH